MPPENGYRIPSPSEYVTGIYAPVGMVETFGVRGTTLLISCTSGLIAGGMTYFVLSRIPEEVRRRIPIIGRLHPLATGAIVGLAVGGMAGFGTYMTAKGVAVGIPVAKK